MGTKLNWDKNKRNRVQTQLQREEAISEREIAIEFRKLGERNKALSEIPDVEKRKLFPHMYKSDQMFSPVGEPDCKVECIHCGDVYNLSEMTLKYRYSNSDPNDLHWGCKHLGCDGVGYGFDIHVHRESRQLTPHEIKQEEELHRQHLLRRNEKEKAKADKIRVEKAKYEDGVQRRAREDKILHERQVEHKRRVEAMKHVPVVEYAGRPYINRKKKPNA